MKTFQYFTLGLVITFMHGCSMEEKISNFDLLCQHFQALEQHKDLAEISSIQRNDFILGKIEKTLALSDVKIAWDALSYFAAEERYVNFKMVAEEELGREWQCDAMQSLAATTGAFE